MDYKPMAKRQIRSAEEILSKRSKEEWQKPELIGTYKYLTEHVIPEAKKFLSVVEEKQ